MSISRHIFMRRHINYHDYSVIKQVCILLAENWFFGISEKNEIFIKSILFIHHNIFQIFTMHNGKWILTFHTHSCLLQTTMNDDRVKRPSLPIFLGKKPFSELHDSSFLTKKVLHDSIVFSPVLFLLRPSCVRDLFVSCHEHFYRCPRSINRNIFSNK